jgi:hypothetical protein
MGPKPPVFLHKWVIKNILSFFNKRLGIMWARIDLIMNLLDKYFLIAPCFHKEALPATSCKDVIPILRFIIRNDKFELGILIYFRLDWNGPSKLFDYLMGNKKPQAGTFLIDLVRVI